MARINIEDQFWYDVGKISHSFPSYDAAIGHVVRFLHLCQSRYKSDRIITETEFIKEGFNLSLEGVFAERVDGGWMAIGADKNFGWLKIRAESGKKGGQQSGKVRRSEINNLDGSKTKQTEANGSKLKPLTLTLSLEESKDSSLERVSVEPPPPPSETKNDQLCQAWNELVTSLPKVKSSSGKRRDLIIRSLKEKPDLEYWRRVFQKVEASDFLSGRNGRWTACNFDWILSNDKNGIRNHVRVDEGVHDNRSSSPQAQRNVTQSRDWQADAERVLQAVRRFGATNPHEASQVLGPDLWGLVRAVGGMSRVGQMPANDFTSKTLASMLKAASEQKKNQPSERTATNASHEHTNQKFHERRGRGDQAWSDQPGGGPQRSGQDNDPESLRVRSEGLVGLITGKNGPGVS